MFGAAIVTASACDAAAETAGPLRGLFGERGEGAADKWVAGQARERVDRFLIEYPLLHVQWFAEQVSDRALSMARGSDQQASAMADYQLALAISDQQMQRNAVLTLVCLVMFSLSALLFLLIRIERNQTLQTQYMANRYVMYMPTPQSDP